MSQTFDLAFYVPPLFKHEYFLNRCPSDYNLKPALFLGKELEDMIHHNVFKVALFHTDFADPENEEVTICCLQSRGRIVPLVHK